MKKHWSTIHATRTSPEFEREDCRIYDPDPLLQSVVSGESTIEVAIELALQAVEIRAQELDKVGIWDDGWGRRPKLPLEELALADNNWLGGIPGGMFD
jgi:hypothetical protein